MGVLWATSGLREERDDNAVGVIRVSSPYKCFVVTSQFLYTRPFVGTPLK
ncbi:MAG: hypothetical protein L3J11_07110 [Draconibacterium sp.]|nr:hypothetical protein [Draconibacterium sp.]